MTAAPCPSCRRPNAAHRAQCIYCGARLPDPAALPSSGRELPDNLDELVRAAMSGQGSVRTLEAALAKKGGDGPTRPVRVEPAPLDAELQPLDGLSLEDDGFVDIPTGALSPVLDEEPLYEEAPRAAIPLTAASVAPLLGAELAKPFDDLAALLAEARRQWEAGQPEEASSRLAQLQLRTAGLRARLRELAVQADAPVVSVDTPAPQSRVSVRHMAGKVVSQPFCLYVECPADASASARVARALGVDGVSAHSLAVCRYPRAARRGDDKEWLEAMAARYRSGLGLQAAVIPREKLLDIGLPKVILGPAGRRGFQISTAPLWTGAPHDPLHHGSGIQAPDITLAVPGAVVSSQFEATPRGRGLGHTYSLAREERIGVIDLHGPGVFLRVVETITEFNGMPGHVPSARRRSFRGFLDQIEEWFPGIRKLGPRVRRPPDPPDPDPSDTSLKQRLVVDGWASWEEHTRLCRLMVGIPAAPERRT